MYISFVKIVQATAMASITPSSTTKTGVGSARALGLNVCRTAAIGNNTMVHLMQQMT